MSKPILAWVTRHPPTPRQRRDFADYRIVQVRYRHGSWQFLYEDILFECRGVPNAIMLTWRGRALKNPHAKLHDMEKALGAHGIQCSMTWGKDSAGREELRITLVPTGETR